MCNRPNIVIVMTDQQRADLRRGCGYELDTMPFLDRWAEGGVDFARAYTPSAFRSFPGGWRPSAAGSSSAGETRARHSDGKEFSDPK